MAKKLGIGCLGIVGVLILLIVVVSIAAPKSDRATVPASGSSGSSGSSSSNAKLGTKESPVPFGQALQFTDKGKKFEVSVVEAKRDDGTYNRQINMFNSTPTPGNEYVMVKMHLKYLEGKESFKTQSGGAAILYQGRMWGKKGLNVEAEPKFGSIDLFESGEVEGWIDTLEVPAGANGMVLNWGQSLIGGGGYWFELPAGL